MRFGANPLDHFIRKGAVADQIAEAVDRVGVSAAQIVEDGLERRQIAVDVTENGDGHDRVLERCPAVLRR